MTPLSDIRYIITYRDDGTAERRANLLAVLRWARSLPEVRVRVVEQADRPGPRLDLPEGVEWLYCYNPGPFNKSWGLNVGACTTESPLLAFGDADVICDATWLEAVRLVREQMPIAKPYRHILDLTAEESITVRAGQWRYQPLRPAQAPPSREGWPLKRGPRSRTPTSS